MAQTAFHTFPTFKGFKRQYCREGEGWLFSSEGEGKALPKGKPEDRKEGLQKKRGQTPRGCREGSRAAFSKSREALANGVKLQGRRAHSGRGILERKGA